MGGVIGFYYGFGYPVFIVEGSGQISGGT